MTIAAGLSCHAAGVIAHDAGDRSSGAAAFFKLQLVGVQDEDRCLEANGMSERSVLKGESFLDFCQDVTGQEWEAQPVGNGRFRLRSSLHGKSRCLSINGGEVPAISVGAPFMAPCVAAVAELVAVPHDGGQRFSLRIDDTEACLGADSSSTHPRALPVRAVRCVDDEDQLWRLLGGEIRTGIPVPAGYARDERVFDAECLWNDGYSDRPDYFACRVEDAPDGTGFAVIGSEQTYSFKRSASDDEIAHGELRVGDRVLKTGNFRHFVDEFDCWMNDETGEFICVIQQ